jgi:prophage maintenance system killer protein
MALPISSCLESLHITPLNENTQSKALAGLIEENCDLSKIKKAEGPEALYSYLLKKCPDLPNADLTKVFKRKKDLTAEVQEQPIEALIKLAKDAQNEGLSDLHFFSIIDLLSAEQALAILKNELSYFKELALLVFNRHLSSFYVSFHKEMFVVPIDSKVAQLANEIWQQYPKFTVDDLTTLPFWDRLEAERCKASKSLSTEKYLHAWKRVNQLYLTRGKVKSFSLKFIRKINLSLRDKQEGNTMSDYRKCSKELNSYTYTPGYSVKCEMKEYTYWLQSELEKCHTEQANPILLAAAIHQRFVTIHPFSDGNGRTARFLADMVLRRYGLLPAVWEKKDVAVAISPNPTPKQSCSPTTHGAFQMIKALGNSYRIAVITRPFIK